MGQLRMRGETYQLPRAAAAKLRRGMPRYGIRVADFGRSKIMAIKLVRQVSGVGLKEAKDLVESGSVFEAELSAQQRGMLEREGHESGIHFEFAALGPGAEPSHASVVGDIAPGGEVAVRYLSGPRKIHAIKLARELSGLGLKEAKELVERQGIVVSGLSRAEAEGIAARFAEFGSQVKLEGSGSGPSLRVGGSADRVQIVGNVRVEDGPPTYRPSWGVGSAWDNEDDDDF